ncbi:cyclin-dependent kinase inhibitor 1B-like isoform X2 [Xyrauchen texanus]|uniref:cyclin-dependent kinase inhibitor 1B-like isoform X2 n=1 Tax=Xyrauchen texanus TaxID=154827 RepID=UPI00224270C0|nr:cyclin-dependent kinase inhibitor 1B-like isoform X2 [Xyrauchen texanus]
MSKVRVSNGSPTLERVDARQADHKPLVCRNLFGSLNREEFERDVKEQLQELEKASSDKWNFDFGKNEPLSPGKYEWQEVDSQDVPEFYSRAHRAKRAETVEHNRNHDYLLTTPSLEIGGEDSGSTEPGSQSDCQTARTTPRKRPSTEDEDLPCQSKRPNVHPTEANHCPDTTDSGEQAPCKSDPKT